MATDVDMIAKPFTSSNKLNRKVPNHLLETKIFTKYSENEIFQTSPSSINFHGFDVEKTSKQTLKITNISCECQRMHIIPPTTPYFKIKYVKKDRLVPGFFMEITVEFNPKEWRYYYDAIRIHCQSEENLVVPIHAYPALQLSEFPKKLDFGFIPVGESEVRTIPLKSDIPVDFDFQLQVSQLTPCITVEPKKGLIPGNGSLEIKVTFNPTEFCTIHAKLQLFVSQFNTAPLVCHVTGSCSPGLKSKLSNKADSPVNRNNQPTKALDPVIIDPLYRSRLKKMEKSQKRSTQNEPENEETVCDGIRFPKNLMNPSAVAYVLQQQPGKLKAKDVREAVKQKKDVPLSTKQLKETEFEYSVQQDILEERQNKLCWCVKLGDSNITELEKERIIEERVQMEQEYFMRRGDPDPTFEFDRSSTSCVQRRIHRQANSMPDCTAKFDSFVNNNWSRRHRVLKRFVQASRKVIIRERVSKRFNSLSQHLEGWRKGEFSPQSPLSYQTRSYENIETSFVLEPGMILPFSFPSYRDETEDKVVNSMDQVAVESSIVKTEPYIPYFDLKVPQQYKLLGYKPHSSQLSVIDYVPKNVARHLRTGAENEVINLVSTLPHTTTNDANLLEIQPVDADENLDVEVVDVNNEPQSIGDNERDNLLSSRSKSRLVIPTEFFKQPKYHPLQIFNPLPGLHPLQSEVSHTEVDEDYHLCPLPRYKLNSKSSNNRQPRAFIERPDVIPGLMTWKRFPNQSLVANATAPGIIDVWVPRWNNPFVDDLLPQETPELLQELPEDDKMNDIEFNEDLVSDASENPAVITPEMVKAMFPLTKPKSTNAKATETGQSRDDVFPRNGKLPGTNNPISDTGLISRSDREKDLLVYNRTQNDGLGRSVRRRFQELNNLVKNTEFHMKL